MPDTTIVKYGRARAPYRRRRRYARKPFRKGTKTSYGLVRRVNRLAKLVQGERKHVDTTPTFSTVYATPDAPSLLSAVTQGDTEQQREGLAIKGQYLVVRYTVFRNASTTALSDLVRAVVVRDNRQRSDTAPSWTDVFANQSWQAHMNWANKGRFTILYDKLVEIDENNPSQTCKAVIPCRFPVRFNGTASTDIEQNGIYFFCIGSAAAEANSPDLFLNSRFVYVDN